MMGPAEKSDYEKEVAKLACLVEAAALDLEDAAVKADAANARHRRCRCAFDEAMRRLRELAERGPTQAKKEGG